MVGGRECFQQMFDLMMFKNIFKDIKDVLKMGASFLHIGYCDERHKSLLNIEAWKQMKISSFVQLPVGWKILGYGKEEKGKITKNVGVPLVHI